MKTATKSSWSKVAQDLCGRWFAREDEEREKAAKEETNKHGNGSLSPVSSSCFLPNLRLPISQIFQTFPPKNAVKPTGDEGKPEISFCGEFSHTTFKKNIEITRVSANRKKKIKKELGAAWSHSFDQLSQLNSDKLCSGLSVERLRRQRVRAQRTVPNGYKSNFPPMDYMFPKDKAWSVFSKRKGPFFVMQMRAGRKLAGTDGVEGFVPRFRGIQTGK